MDHKKYYFQLSGKQILINAKKDFLKITTIYTFESTNHFIIKCL